MEGGWMMHTYWTLVRKGELDRYQTMKGYPMSIIPSLSLQREFLLLIKGLGKNGFSPSYHTKGLFNRDGITVVNADYECWYCWWCWLSWSWSWSYCLVSLGYVLVHHGPDFQACFLKKHCNIRCTTCSVFSFHPLLFVWKINLGSVSHSCNKKKATNHKICQLFSVVTLLLFRNSSNMCWI